MKKLAVLIALVLALSSTASALTLTSDDLKAPPFQWGGHSLTLSLYTDDPGEMDYEPVPAQGSLAMVRLTSSGGQIALEDIQSGVKQFLLKDATGALNEPFDWHVRGTTEKNGAAETNPMQDAFELVYFLPAGVPSAGAALLLRNLNGSDQTIFQMPDAEQAAASEPSAEATPGAESTPAAQAAEPDKRASDFIGALLSESAKDVTDPWTLAILDAGAQDVTMEDGVLRFALRSFNPGLNSIEETEPAGFLRRLFENASAYGLACALEVTDEGGLAATDKARKALMKTVQKAAGQSRKAFDNKKVRVALAGYLLGDAAGDMDYAVTLGDFSPLFAAQSKQALNVKDGPHALKLSTTGAKTADLMQNAYSAALQRLSKQEGAKELDEGGVASVFLEELNAQAAALKKKGSEKLDFTINLDALFSPDYASAGDEYNDFLYDFSDAFSARLQDLTGAVSDFPDYPAVDFPKSGRLGGSSKGTRVIYRIPKDNAARFLQMRKVDSDELAVSAFIRPGEKATVRVPKGMYYILLASGEIWYGEEYLFGDGGSYARTEDIEIMGSNYYHTITLGGAENGNMASYGADPSEFQ